MITCIEFLDMKESAVRVISANRKSGLLVVENTVEASFNLPFGRITHKDVKCFFKRHNIKAGKLLLLLPGGFEKSILWQEKAEDTNSRRKIQSKMYKFATDNKELLEISKDTLVYTGFFGEADGINYGMISSALKEKLDKLYKAFNNYNLQCVLPRMAGLSHISFAPEPKYSAVMNIGQESLEFAAYSGNLLIWYQSLPVADSREKAVFKDALIAAGNKYIYPSTVYLTGSCNKDMADSLSNEIDIPCHIPKGYGLNSEETRYLLLLSIARGLKNGRHN